MYLATALHSLILLFAEVLLLRRWFRTRHTASLAGTVLGVVVIGLVAGLVGEDAFGMIRLWTWTLGIHLPGVLLFAGAVGWSRSPRMAASALAVGLLGASVTVWAVLVEPQRIEVTHYTIPVAALDAPVTVVVLADIQTDEVGEYEAKALRLAMAEKPDLLVFPGDYIQLEDQAERQAERGRLNALLKAETVQARWGAVAVEGNMEAGDWLVTFAGLDYRVRVGTSRYRMGPFTVDALSLADSFDTQFTVAPVDGPHLVVGHAPDFSLGRFDADVMIAGHTHGGQVRIPGIGPLMTLSEVPRDHASGVHRLSDGRWLAVSRGVGHERGYAPPLRLFCRPEIMVLRLVPTE